MYRFFPSLKNYPKDEKHALTAELRKAIIESRTLVEEGASCKSIRKQKYKDALSKLQIVSSYLSVSEMLSYITINHARIMRMLISEIIAMLRKLMQVEASGMRRGILAIDTEEGVIVN